MTKSLIGDHAVVLGASSAYSLALPLRDAGVADDLIAEFLAVDREALDPMLDVAEAKLAAILGGEN